MKRLAVGLATACLLTLAAPAHAGRTSDPDDTASKLDISFLKASVVDDLVTLRLETHDIWGSRFLKDDMDTSLKWAFDKGDDGDVDLVGDFVFRKGELVLILEATQTTRVYEPVPAVRPGRRTVKVQFPADLPELAGNSVTAFARSTDAVTDACGDDGCKDRAPNKGALTVI